MNAGMKMLMVDAARKSNSGRSGGRMDYGESNYARMGYDGAENGYGAENRFRDRTGRDHYDNGRFAPMRNDTNIEIEGRFRDDRGGERFQNRYGTPMRSGMDDMETRNNDRGNYGARSAYPFVPPVYRGGDMRYGGERMNQIGFVAGDDVGMNYPMDATYSEEGRHMHHNEDRMRGYSMGSEEEHMPALTRDMAIKWVKSMEGPEGVKGQFWSMDQAANIMSKEGYQCNPIEWYVAMNMMKRDYAKVAAKLGVDKDEFYAGMAHAFLHDSDALPDKLMRYYQAVVKKN